MLELTENHCQLVEEPDCDVYAFPILCARDYKWLVHYSRQGREGLYDYLYRCLYFHKPSIRSFDRTRVRSLEVKDIDGRHIDERPDIPAKLVILKVNLRNCKCNGDQQ